ncbi:hypothetical protein [Oceanobacillus manasiensis]|uniref:hypothetical protein n=1 Tax=Oceanobacillus manasiensis TaxID=586413 RepID=UPI0005A76B06|nr:hypothetical protein [Oceanobacillus manasiensis]
MTISPGFRWISSSDEPTAQTLIADYEQSSTKADQIKKEIIKRYLREYGLPAFIVNKAVNANWSEGDFAKILDFVSKLDY